MQTGPPSHKTVLDLDKLLDKRVRVKFVGGREVTGLLKGHDTVSNLVLDDTEEFLRDPEASHKHLEATRALGLIVARGTSVMLIAPVEGSEVISNPFVDAEEQE